MIILELYELKNICKEMAELGAANFIKSTKPADDAISQNEAYRVFGKSRVMRWYEQGRVKRTRNGASIRSKLLYSRAELLAVDKSEKINGYINK